LQTYLKIVIKILKMASTSEIKNGLCIEYNHDVYQVVEFLHVKPGKGAAFVRTKLKSLTNGRVLDNTFPSGHKIDIVRIERRKFQYLYSDEMGMNFMNNETYDQIILPTALIPSADLIKEGTEVDVLYHSEKDEALTVEIPSTIILEVIYSEPGIKGDTATNAMKPAKLETGAEIRVPLFINNGDKIKVDTSTRQYLERAK
jgi:elongation factor P